MSRPARRRAATGRHRLRQHDRRRPRRGRAGGDRAADEARRRRGLPMQRELGPDRCRGLSLTSRAISHRSNADVLHGHGAKGGAFVRLMSAPAAIRVYTPHGGSLHYGRHTLRGMVYGDDRAVSQPPHRTVPVRKRVRPQRLRGDGRRAARHRARGANGISAAEMAPVEPRADAADLVSVGEFRHIKGTDVLIEALAELHRSGRRVSLAIAGDGEEGPALREQVAASRPDRQRPLPRPHAGAAGLRARPAAGGAVARRLPALRRDRGWRRRNPDRCQRGGRHS